jgi:hypothetical protein
MAVLACWRAGEGRVQQQGAVEMLNWEETGALSRSLFGCSKNDGSLSGALSGLWANVRADSARLHLRPRRSVQKTPTTHEKGSPPFVLTAYPILDVRYRPTLGPMHERACGEV